MGKFWGKSSLGVHFQEADHLIETKFMVGKFWGKSSLGVHFQEADQSWGKRTYMHVLSS